MKIPWEHDTDVQFFVADFDRKRGFCQRLEVLKQLTRCYIHVFYDTWSNYNALWLFKVFENRVSKKFPCNCLHKLGKINKFLRGDLNVAHFF